MASELAVQNHTPMGLLQLAIEREGSIDVIERLAKLQQDFMEREARIAYAEAVAEFKRDLPKIIKTKQVAFESKQPGKKDTSYFHVELDKASEVLVPALLKVGLTHRWTSTPQQNGGTIVTCYLKHVLGHEEAGASLAAPPDQSGGKNAIQAVGSTMTYLQRYTLLATCGIAPTGMDTDAVPPPPMKGLAECLEDLEKATTPTIAKNVWRAGTAAAREANDGNAVLQIMAAYEAATARLGGK